MVTTQPDSQQSRQGRKWSRYLRYVAAACAPVVAWVIIGFFLFVAPKSDIPTNADVLFVLGPPDQRLDQAEQLMRDGYAPTLAVSVPRGENGNYDADICTAQRTYRIVCFHPEPFTTQGEARALRDLSIEHGWRSANVITAQFHVVRAEITLGRCYGGNIHMVANERILPAVALDNPTGSWAYHYAYQSAAFVKLALNPGC